MDRQELLEKRQKIEEALGEATKKMKEIGAVIENPDSSAVSKIGYALDFLIILSSITSATNTGIQNELKYLNDKGEKNESK